MDEIGTHSTIERVDVVTLDLKVRATQFYPNQFRESPGEMLAVNHRKGVGKSSPARAAQLKPRAQPWEWRMKVNRALKGRHRLCRPFRA